MDRQHHLAAQVDMGLQRFLGLHVNVGPLRIVSAGLHHRQIERAVAAADFLEAVEIAAVAGKEDARLAVLDHERRPQRLVAVGQAAAREMLGRRGQQAYAIDLRALPPAQLTHLVSRNTPGNQAVAHAQRGDEHLGPGRQRHDRRMIEVVVMVVRQDDALKRRQVLHADRRLVETLGTGPLHRRGAFREHRVGEPEAAVKLEQHG